MVYYGLHILLLGILNDIDVFGLFKGQLFGLLFTTLTFVTVSSICRNVLSQADFQQVHSDIETEQMLAGKAFRPPSWDDTCPSRYIPLLHKIICTLDIVITRYMNELVHYDYIMCI